MSTPDHPHHPKLPLYGVVIHGCIAKGDLGEMKAVAARAEQQLAEHGDLSAALEALRAEIAKAEHRSGPRG